MKYTIGEQVFTAKRIEKSGDDATYSILADGVEVGQVEKLVFPEHKNFPGKRYGYTTAERVHWNIVQIDGKLQRHFYHGSLNMAVTALARKRGETDR